MTKSFKVKGAFGEVGWVGMQMVSHEAVVSLALKSSFCETGQPRKLGWIRNMYLLSNMVSLGIYVRFWQCIPFQKACVYDLSLTTIASNALLVVLPSRGFFCDHEIQEIYEWKDEKLTIFFYWYIWKVFFHHFWLSVSDIWPVYDHPSGTVVGYVPVASLNSLLLERWCASVFRFQFFCFHGFCAFNGFSQFQEIVETTTNVGFFNAVF